MREMPDLDVLIVGAGLSGIAAAWRIQTRLPGKRYAVLEARDAVGGTWDLFRYPGVRSDSDMNTLGFSFNPWPSEKTIADGGDIRDYIAGTAARFDIEQHIRFNSRMTSADWDSRAALWRVVIDRGEAGSETLTCRFLYMSTGYYDYAAGYQPTWPGTETFGGTLIHPQHWPQDLDYSGRRVVIIGSGATAVTLAPAMAATAGSVTLLQRSPTYIVSRPAIDPTAHGLQGRLPDGLTRRIVRWKNILLGAVIFGLARFRPEMFAKRIIGRAQEALGEGYDMRHFTPRYAPWDQRLCLIPDGDLFTAVRDGRVEMVTDEIEAFDASGLALKSGRHLDADIVVSATGLQVRLMGHAALSIDGQAIRLADRVTYKGALFDGLPNFAYAFGYTNASWTLKCELTADLACRLIRRLDQEGMDWCMPRLGSGVETEELLDFSSGYIQRARSELPRQGRHAPWKAHQNYIRDLLDHHLGGTSDGALVFGRAAQR